MFQRPVHEKYSTLRGVSIPPLCIHLFALVFSASRVYTLRVRRLPSSSWTGRQCHQPPPLRDKCPREFHSNTESCVVLLKCTLIRFASFNAGNFLLKNPYEVRGKVSKTQRLPSQYRSLSFHHGLGKLILTKSVFNSRSSFC